MALCRECVRLELSKTLHSSDPTAHFSENWGLVVLSVIGGNVFSVAFGKNVDKHTSGESDLLTSSALEPQTDRLGMFLRIAVSSLGGILRA